MRYNIFLPVEGKLVAVESLEIAEATKQSISNQGYDYCWIVSFNDECKKEL